MKTTTVGNLLKSGVVTLNDPVQKKMYVLKLMVYLLTSTFSVIDTTNMWTTEGLVNVPDVFDIDEEFDDITDAHPGAIVQDVASRASDIDEYFDMFQTRGVAIPDEVHPSPYEEIITATLPGATRSHKKLDWVILDVPDALIRLGCRIMTVPAPIPPPSTSAPITSTPETIDELQQQLEEIKLKIARASAAPPLNVVSTSGAPPLDVASTSAAPPLDVASTSAAPPLNVASTSAAPPLNVASTSAAPHLNVASTSAAPPLNVASPNKKKRSDDTDLISKDLYDACNKAADDCQTKITEWLESGNRDLTDQAVMKEYLEINPELIQGEGGKRFSQLQREHKNWSVVKNTDDAKMARVYDETWHIKFKHQRPCSKNNDKKRTTFLGVDGVQLSGENVVVRLYTPKAQYDNLPKIIDVRRKDTRWTSHLASTDATSAEYSANLDAAGILCNLTQKKDEGNNPLYLDFHEHVGSHLKLEPLSSLAQCFLPYVPRISSYNPLPASKRQRTE